MNNKNFILFFLIFLVFTIFNFGSINAIETCSNPFVRVGCINWSIGNITLHNELGGLDYASAGHTGFEPTITNLGVNRGGTGRTSWTQYAIPFLSGTTTFGQISIGSGGDCLKVNSTGDGYEWGSCTGGTESDPKWTANYSDYLNTKNYALNDSRWTLNYSNFSIIYAYAINDTNWNASGLIRNWNASGLIINWSSASSEPNWNANYSDYLIIRTYALNDTNYNSSGLIRDWNASGLIINWSYLTNGFVTWANVVNGTMMSQATFNTNYTTNDPAYRNMTNNSYYLVTNPYSYYNSTNPSPETLWNANSSTVARTGNCPSGQFVVNTTTGGVQCASAGAITETDPYWTANYSLYNSTWTSTYNSTYHAYNSTGLIRDWNASGLIINWSSASSEPLWNANYSTFLTKINWTQAINGTLMSQATFNTNYSTLMLQSTWNTNYTSNDAAWRNTTNSTYHAYNSSGLIRDWNSSGWIVNWWIPITNGTMLSQATYNTNYSTLMLQATFNTNYTTNDPAYRNMTNTSYLLKSGDTMTGNLNMSSNNVTMMTNGYTCYGSGCNGSIYYNGSSLIIKVT